MQRVTCLRANPTTHPAFEKVRTDMVKDHRMKSTVPVGQTSKREEGRGGAESTDRTKPLPPFAGLHEHHAGRSYALQVQTLALMWRGFSEFNQAKLLASTCVSDATCSVLHCLCLTAARGSRLASLMGVVHETLKLCHHPFSILMNV